MSVSITPQARDKPIGRQWVLAQFSIAAAYLISLFPPQRLATVLTHLIREAPSSSATEVSYARANVCAISARCAGQGCLQRAIATVLLCRLRGHSPVLKSGYQIRPFRAHAWVEAEGKAIDEPEDIGTYVEVLEIAPERNRSLE